MAGLQEHLQGGGRGQQDLRDDGAYFSAGEVIER